MQRVVLVEDHAAFRQALAYLLDEEPDIEVVAQAGSLAECHDLKELEGRIDVVVLDLLLPDGDGANLIPKLREDHGASVMVLTGTLDPAHGAGAAELGADALLDKTRAVTEVVEVVRRLGRDGHGPKPSLAARTGFSLAS